MIQGITVSKWQGEMDWYKARNTGARFGFIRAGSCTDAGGLLYADDQFERNASLGPAHLPVGFFWYFRPYHDPVKQADYFCNLIQGRKWKLPPACDLECSSPSITPSTTASLRSVSAQGAQGGSASAQGDYSTVASTTPSTTLRSAQGAQGLSLSAVEVTNATKAFCYRVYHRLSVWPLLYSRAAWLNAHTVADDFWSRLEFWVARYTSKPQPWGNLGDSPELTPRDFTTWRFWQKSADGNGLGREYGAESDSICIEYFNGDEAEFAEYIQGWPAQLVRVKKPAAALRSSPEGAVIGTTWRGRTWQATGCSSDGAWTRVEGWIKSLDVDKL